MQDKSKDMNTRIQTHNADLLGKYTKITLENHPVMILQRAGWYDNTYSAYIMLKGTFHENQTFFMLKCHNRVSGASTN